MSAAVNFMRLPSLPSGLRLYPELSSIKVRGLFFHEVITLASYLDRTADVAQLSSSYADIIQLEDNQGNKFNNELLELSDFHYLMVVSSIMTDDKVAWNTSRECPSCRTRSKYTIQSSNIEYTEPTVTQLPVPLEMEGIESGYSIKPLRVIDKIVIDSFERIKLLYNQHSEIKINNNDQFKTVLSYAVSLNWNTEFDLVKNIEFLVKNPKINLIVKQLNEELAIRLKPVVVNCKADGCGYPVRFIFDFSEIRGYL